MIARLLRLFRWFDRSVKQVRLHLDFARIHVPGEVNVLSLR